MKHREPVREVWEASIRRRAVRKQLMSKLEAAAKWLEEERLDSMESRKLRGVRCIKQHGDIMFVREPNTLTLCSVVVVAKEQAGRKDSMVLWADS